MFEICFAKIIDFLANADPAIAQILQTLHDSHALIFKDLSCKRINKYICECVCLTYYCLFCFRDNCDLTSISIQASVRTQLLSKKSLLNGYLEEIH